MGSIPHPASALPIRSFSILHFMTVLIIHIPLVFQKDISGLQNIRVSNKSRLPNTARCRGNIR